MQMLKEKGYPVKIGIEICNFKNQEDQFLRHLSTEEIMKTRWFEKYGIKEPQF